MILTVNESRSFLRRPTVEVDPLSPDTQATIEALLAEVAALDAAGGDSHCAGLAANQIGHGSSIFVARLTMNSDELTVCINPNLIYHYVQDRTISSVMDSAVSIEGCYSHPGEFYVVRRHQHVTLTWTDSDGEIHAQRLSGLPAIIAQHEHDHLDGTLISDIGKKAVQSPQDPTLAES